MQTHTSTPNQKLTRRMRLELSARHDKHWGLLRPVPRQLTPSKPKEAGAFCARCA